MMESIYKNKLELIDKKIIQIEEQCIQIGKEQNQIEEQLEKLEEEYNQIEEQLKKSKEQSMDLQIIAILKEQKELGKRKDELTKKKEELTGRKDKLRMEKEELLKDEIKIVRSDKFEKEINTQRTSSELDGDSLSDTETSSFLNFVFINKDGFSHHQLERANKDYLIDLCLKKYPQNIDFNSKSKYKDMHFHIFQYLEPKEDQQVGKVKKVKIKFQTIWDIEQKIVIQISRTNQSNETKEHVGFLLTNPGGQVNLLEMQLQVEMDTLCFCKERELVYFKSTRVTSSNDKEDYESMLYKFGLMQIYTKCYHVWRDSNLYHRILFCKNEKGEMHLLHFFYL